TWSSDIEIEGNPADPQIVHALMYQLLASAFFFSSRRRHTRCYRDWSSAVCSSDLPSRRCRGPACRPRGWRRTRGARTRRRGSGEIGRASCRERVEISTVVVWDKTTIAVCHVRAASGRRVKEEEQGQPARIQAKAGI